MEGGQEGRQLQAYQGRIIPPGRLRDWRWLLFGLRLLRLRRRLARSLGRLSGRASPRATLG
eukprot:1505498-Alexandrium_andersonii.AAC.1